MPCAAIAPTRQQPEIHYLDYGAHAWLRTGAPYRWRNNAEVEFRQVPLSRLQTAISGKDPRIVQKYIDDLNRGRGMAPMVVSETPAGRLYVHDGNHRHAALRAVLPPEAFIRVAVVVPQRGYCFRWRWFADYGTYVLEPVRGRRVRRPEKTLCDTRLSPLLGRTFVLVAHPDDETGGCAALLVRVHEPMVVYATDGVPLDEFFWRDWGTRAAYSRVRRNEARHALRSIGVPLIHFLDDCAPGSLIDQQLHEVLRQAIPAVLDLVAQHRADAILVPAYEGGHPDHDACSFIGSTVGRMAGVPVWEMPLYHRSSTGELTCQRFRHWNGTEVELTLNAADLASRRTLVSHYTSQRDLARFITSKVEYFRPQPRYDYCRPPHEGTVNYEVWGWAISASEVCCNFREYMANSDREKLASERISERTGAALVRPSLAALQPGGKVSNVGST